MDKLPVAGDRSDSYSADIDFIHRIALMKNIHINKWLFILLNCSHRNVFGIYSKSTIEKRALSKVKRTYAR